MTELRKQTHLKASLQQEQKIKMLLSGLGSVRIGKNCDLGLENAALVPRPRVAFSRPRSQFFPKRTSQPASNIYICQLKEFKGPMLKIDKANIELLQVDNFLCLVNTQILLHKILFYVKEWALSIT